MQLLNNVIMGKFNNKIEAEFNPPRKWILSRPLSYQWDYDAGVDEISLKTVGISIKEHKIVVNEGFITDLASVPRIIWNIIAPWDVARAAIIHDLLYKRIRIYRYEHDRTLKNSENPVLIKAARKSADNVFLLGMKDANPSVPKWKIYAAYYSVRLFGRWSILPRKK